MLEIDLVRLPPHSATTPVEVATQHARTQFYAQLGAQGLRLKSVMSAWLRIATQQQPIQFIVNEHSVTGYVVQVTAVATNVKGETFEIVREIHVAPHNPDVEHRRMNDL